MFRTIRAAAFIGSLLFPALHAQVVEESAVKTASSTAELAQKLTNPVADMVSVPFQFNWNGRIGPQSKGQTAYLHF